MKVIKKEDSYHVNLTTGKEYEVLVVDDNHKWYKIIDDSGKEGSYDQHRFRKVPALPSIPVAPAPVAPQPVAPQPVEKVTMKVICRDDSLSTITLTEGLTYDVVTECNKFYQIKNDVYDIQKYRKDRFEVVPAPAPMPPPMAETPTYEGKLYDIVPESPPAAAPGPLVLLRCVESVLHITEGWSYRGFEQGTMTYIVEDDRGIPNSYDSSRFTKEAWAAPVPTAPSMPVAPTAPLTGIVGPLPQQYIVTPEGPSYLTKVEDYEGPVNSTPRSIANGKICHVSYYKTTDGDEHVLEKAALDRQLMLDAENDFTGPVDDSWSKVGLREMLDWAKEQPESFNIVQRLVREQNNED
jgi:hypothetical protein